MPKSLDSQILAAIRREVKRLSAIDLTKIPYIGHREHYAEVRHAVETARSGAIAYDLDVLLGHPPTDAERKAAQRAIARLEARGKLVKLALGYGRVKATHLMVAETAT
jgi:hypothetical protein